ncbi:MAG: hypothetical protein RR053_01425 [Evtepia sp.]
MTKSKKLALCGMLGALMIVIMLLGSLFPMATYCYPAIAGFLLIPVARECGGHSAATLYIATSLLSLMLIPDKEGALLFLFLFGLYPLIKPYVQKIHLRSIRIVVKLIFFDGMFFLAYLLLRVLFMPELSMFASQAMAIVFIVIGNITFLLYDFCLVQLSLIYEYRLRPKLHFRN